MIEIQDIFNQYGDEYRRNHQLPLHILKTMIDIEACRTEELGGHIDECDECGHIRVSYNSCRNRHCPKCQTLAKERWLEKRKEDLLPVGYFHVVFTIPQELNYITLTNQKEMYSILFNAVSETLFELSRDKKYLGAEIGFMSILHTWGQNLMNHPHMHCIVPSGGLTFDGTKWINSKKNFFIPVKVLSRIFRGKFLFYLKKAYYSNALKYTTGIEELTEKHIFQSFVGKLYKKEWVVYCKPPFGSAEYVLEYLGRYTHRVAISNHRIVNLENGYVTFKWRDYKDHNKEKFMTLAVDEFIRRFLMHVLPRKFVKIRHYGILSNRNRSTKLQKCKELTGAVQSKGENSDVKLSAAELLLKMTGIDINTCSCCGKGKMIIKEKLNRQNFSPPCEKKWNSVS
ncbi:IS91 family transposase [Clostridium sp. FP1]|uniref:IS91 family transposase n=1 Tax=Clostridium sp. FP1 TaxID=2724076 RepID=UPI001CCFE2B7|nr:IS91 family transposase [Clostridium sp. FP1]MBZ9634629.1 IS91 family transposase [Clostridium sp. FP1]MBZ9634679.1 IS91 family transposase [Clostridium sp. FP1]MBZ9634825.1 IS91 family transposase [Clostridium sp. FP1]MBZ9635077.1 IS91 family transposase [Clostridium sp. FP1]MBZ9637743.1 IS91 family transposase [Clostridium sp. FP1]